MRLPRRLLRAVTYRQARPRTASKRDDEHYRQSALRFLDRFGGPLDFTGKTVLDVGCGRSGALAAELARRGAARVVGIDLDGADVASDAVRRHAPEVADRVDFLLTDGSLCELRDSCFDVVLSKDSFEHFDDPETFAHVLARHVRPGGELLIGFGPLWKSPTGGHIDYMTRLPWAHLLFAEDAVLAERQRFKDDGARTFAEVPGGLNKMTLRRFEAIMASTGLERRSLLVNQSEHLAVRAMAWLARVPVLREYFANNVYSRWVKPA